jgi:hypothetical protein
MRVICEHYAMEIKYAECVGKYLVLTSYDGKFYHTDEYYAENIARCALNDLVVNGWIRVTALYLHVYGR